MIKHQPVRPAPNIAGWKAFDKSWSGTCEAQKSAEAMHAEHGVTRGGSTKPATSEVPTRFLICNLPKGCSKTKTKTVLA